MVLDVVVSNLMGVVSQLPVLVEAGVEIYQHSQDEYENNRKV